MKTNLNIIIKGTAASTCSAAVLAIKNALAPVGVNIEEVWVSKDNGALESRPLERTWRILK